MGPRRLYRSSRESKIAGVCGGIAEHLDIDPVAVRLAAVALTLAAPPVGLLSYAVAWILIPSEPPPGPVPPSSSEPAPPPPPPSHAPDTPSRPATGPAEDRRPAGPRLEGPAFGGLVLVIIGLALLMLNLGLYDWGIFRLIRWRYIWPTALIACGVGLLAGGLRARDGGGEGGHGR